MRLLLVDDHPLVRRGLKAVLCDALPGLVVVEAGTADEVWRRLEAGAPDLVLLDISLGPDSGIDVLTELKRRYPRLPVLIVTAHPEEDFAVRCLRADAAGYVSKDAAPDELVVAVRKVLGGGRYVTAALAERLALAIGSDLRVDPHELLSGRELQVLRLIARGQSLKQVAGQLGLSEKTVATYRARLGSKLGLSTNVELARYAISHKLTD